MNNDIELNEDSQKPQDEESDDSTTVAEEEEGELSIEDKNAKLEESNKKLFARAKKAETELKASKESSKEEKDSPASEAPEKKEEPKIDELVNKAVDEKMEEKELNAIEISDEAKTEIKAYAKAKGFTVKQVLDSDFFKFLKEKEDEAARVEEAGIGGKRKAPTKQDFSAGVPKPDMSTKEGRQEWADYKKWLKSQ